MGGFRDGIKEPKRQDDSLLLSAVDRWMALNGVSNGLFPSSEVSKSQKVGG